MPAVDSGCGHKDIVYTIYLEWRFPMSTQMIIRIDDAIKAKLARIAKAEGKTTSHVLR
jgi:hypothetical protein